MNCICLGAGYIGRPAIQKIKDLGAHTMIYSRNPRFDEIKWPGPCSDAFDTMLLTVAPKRAEDYEETYLKTAQTIAKDPKFKRVIYTSSISVYGDQNGALVTEETPVQASNALTQILIDTEKTLLDSGKNVLIFRLGEIFGLGREIAKKHVKGKTFPGTGENLANLSPFNAILEGILFGFNKNLSGVYNLVAEAHPTRKELYESLGLAPKFNPSLPSQHGGNKIVSSKKLIDIGFVFPAFELV